MTREAFVKHLAFYLAQQNGYRKLPAENMALARDIVLKVEDGMRDFAWSPETETVSTD